MVTAGPVSDLSTKAQCCLGTYVRVVKLPVLKSPVLKAVPSVLKRCSASAATPLRLFHVFLFEGRLRGTKWVQDLMETFYTELLKESESPFHRARALRGAPQTQQPQMVEDQLQQRSNGGP